MRGYEKLVDNGSTEVEWRAVEHPEEEPWVRKMECGGDVSSVALSSDGATIVSGDYSNKVTLWNAATGEKRHEMECGGEVWSVALSSDGATIVSGDRSNKVTLWDAATGEKRREMECGGAVCSVALSSDGATIVSDDDSNKVTLFLHLTDAIAFYSLPSPLPYTSLGTPFAPWSLLNFASASGRTIVTHAARQGDVAWLDSLLARPETPKVLVALSVLHRDLSGYCAIDYLRESKKDKGVRLLLECVFDNAFPCAGREALLVKPRGHPNCTLTACAPFLAGILAKPPQASDLARPEQLYLQKFVKEYARASLAALYEERWLVRGHPGDAHQPPRTLWHGENGVDAVSEDAADAVDVTCGVVGIPGLLAAPARGNKTLFAAIVATEDLGAIASGPMRAAIDFKWQAFGKRRWQHQVCIYIGFAVCYLGGVAGLLLSTTAAAWWAGTLLFAMAQLFNLYYAMEEWFEAKREELEVYLASPTNWVDAVLMLVTVLLVPLLMVQSADALAREVCVACAQTSVGSRVAVVGVSCAPTHTRMITLAYSAGGRSRHDADLHEDC